MSTWTQQARLARWEGRARLAHGARADLFMTILLTMLSLLVASPILAAEEHTTSPPPGGDTLSMSRFYSGALVKTGEFPGTLVCLRCDLKPSPGAMAQCEKEGHRHALSMEEDSMIHPLLAGNAEVLTQINSGDLHGKRVTVHGTYYPSTGAIFVDSVSASK